MSFAYIGSVYRLENSAWPHLWPSTGSDYVETVRTRASGSTVFGLKSTQKSTKVVKKWWRICSGPRGRWFKSSHSEYKKSHVCLPDKRGIFWTKCACGTRSTPSVREAMLRIVKCLRAHVAHFTSRCAKHNTSLWHLRCFTWRSQTSRNVEKSNTLKYN